MNRRTQAIIGATLAALGIGVLALGALEQDSTVRYVDQILAEPAAHDAGTYTLLGIPQPPTLQVVGSDGTTRTDPNPAFTPETRHTALETMDGRTVQVTATLTVSRPDPHGASHWTLERTTRVPGTDIAETQEPVTWTIAGPHHLFLIQGFTDAQGDTPAVWGVYEGTLDGGVQPKPSQFEGRLQRGLPAGALVYQVETYTAGCSSKFLPPEVAAEYDEDQDGTTD